MNWSREEFVTRLREIGARAYHDKHPFHLAMNEGWLSKEAIRGWVANRFYYQQNIPRKDAAILANCPVREVRRIWVHRVLDHDGVVEAAVPSGSMVEGRPPSCPAASDGGSYKEGGIEAWLRLGEACGLTQDELPETAQVLPVVRCAVVVYVEFARTDLWPVAVASALGGVFAPDLLA